MSTTNGRGALYGLTGILIIFGFVIVVGVLMSTVAHTQKIDDPKEGVGLDLRSVAMKHTKDRFVIDIKTYGKWSPTRLSAEDYVQIDLDTGQGDYLVQLTGGSAGPVVTVTPCHRTCNFEQSVIGVAKKTGPRSVHLWVDRSAMVGLADRVEWRAESVLDGAIDRAPDTGSRFHHL
jgi:hypothetical protein